jgi:hypothetical protein
MQSERTSNPLLIAAIGLSLFCGFLVAPAFAIPLRQDRPFEVDTRSIGDYRSDLKTFMKLSKDDHVQLERNAIYNLCQLHREIVTDPRLESSQQLQGIRAVIAKRLETYSNDVKNAKLRNDRKSRSSSNRSSEPSDPAPTGNRETASETSASNPAEASQYTTVSVAGADASESMYESSSDSYYSMGQFTGGPNQLFGYAGGRFAPPWAHGEELVDLIVNTLDPTFWRRNGGPGSIHYFRPLRVLVLRAPMQAQGDVEDLLNKLRAAGDVQLNVGGVGAAIGN